MIDNDDATWVAIIWPAGGWVCSVLGLIVVIALAFIAHDNRKQCEARACSHGTPKLIDHECLCVDAPGTWVKP